MKLVNRILEKIAEEKHKTLLTDREKSNLKEELKEERDYRIQVRTDTLPRAAHSKNSFTALT